LWLKDGFVCSPGDVDGRGKCPVWMDWGGPEFGGVPGHVRMVPGEPCKLGAVRAKAGGGVEVVALDETFAGVIFVEADGDDGVAGFMGGLAVVFADADDAVTGLIHDAVCVAHVGFGGDGFG